MTDKALDPSTPSLAHERLADTWKMVRAIRAGAKAVKDAGETYLPRFPAESDGEYNRRKASAPWRPEFEDCIRGVSSKPFTDEVKLAGEPSEEMKALAEDIDGRGNNLHCFARELFENGVSMGAAGILVDYPPMQPNATKAQEKAAGARPYWVSVAADEIIALRTERKGAAEIVTHLRLRETVVVINGFEETTKERIRVIEPGRWEIWEATKGVDGRLTWAIVEQGTLTLSRVPFVLFTTGERIGPQYVRPPLLDLATMQVELYNALSIKEQAYTMLGAPMLSANGMAPPIGDDGEPLAIETGPNRILYAPGGEGFNTSWSILSAPAGSLKELRDDCAAIVEDMRRLGLQPMLPKTGNVTATASGIEAAKAHSAVGTWANALKDALEQAFIFTAEWLKSSDEVEVSINTDFAVGQWGESELSELRSARDAGDLSQRTYWDELSRRGVLGPQFDPDNEVDRITEELPGDEDDADSGIEGLLSDRQSHELGAEA